MRTKSKSYYGGFFWLAAVSFIVPLFVAYAAFDQIRPASKPTPEPDVSGVDQKVWDYLLRTYVADGLIDYDGLSRDYLFKVYLEQLSGAEPEKLDSAEDKLALHCNAYNALVINGVISHKIHLREKNVLSFRPPQAAAKLAELEQEIQEQQAKQDAAQIAALEAEAQKIRSGPGFFQLKEHLFANRTISLDEMEHQLIRPVFLEPRIHVALVCAAKSCPAIRAEAYVGKRIDAQLEDQSRQFANNERYLSFDPASNTLNLSPILSWYGQDWDAMGGYVAWLEKLVETPELRQKLSAAQTGQVAVKFNDYDWSLNSQSIGGGTGKATKSFGSGSVPNE